MHISQFLSVRGLQNSKEKLLWLVTKDYPVLLEPSLLHESNCLSYFNKSVSYKHFFSQRNFHFKLCPNNAFDVFEQNLHFNLSLNYSCLYMCVCVCIQTSVASVQEFFSEIHGEISTSLELTDFIDHEITRWIVASHNCALQSNSNNSRTVTRELRPFLRGHTLGLCECHSLNYRNYFVTGW